MGFYPFVPSSSATAQPYQFYVDAASTGVKGDGQVGLCSITNGSGVVTVTTGTVTAADVGKNVCINGGTGSPPTSAMVDTIASVNVGANQWTLATQTSTVNATGVSVVWSSDDRTKIDAVIQAAATYAEANGFTAEVIFGNKIYGLGTGLFQTLGVGTQYNTQLRIPAGASFTGQKLQLTFSGPGDNSHEQYWEASIPNLNGTALMSYTVGPTTPNATYGQQSVFGCVTGGLGAAEFANVKPIFKGIQVWQPGWGNTIGFDVLWCGGYTFWGAGSFAFAPPTSDNGYNPYNAWQVNSFWQGKISIGFRYAGVGNNQDAVVISAAAGGLNTGHYGSADGYHATLLRSVSCGVAYEFDTTLGLGGTPHGAIINRLYWENCNAGITVNGGNEFPVDIYMDSEISSLLDNDVFDTSNALHGVIRWNDPFRSVAIPTVSGAANVQIINDQMAPGHWPAASGNLLGPPAVPSSTGSVAATALPWRPAVIVVHTGAGVTVSSISIGGTVTGLTMAASSSLQLPLLPSGQTVSLTYAGGTPTWDWWLQ